jgi:hypothetical protein
MHLDDVVNWIFNQRLFSPSSIVFRRKRPVFRHKSLFTNAGFVQSAVV